MGDEQAVEIKENSIVQSVTPVGSSWIVCRSKSHSGRVYYFNTLTGEAAWNLSDAEIDKAKKQTNIIQNQIGGEFATCPEPKEPPSHALISEKYQNGHIYCAPQVYNKQIINNQLSKQTYLPIETHCSKPEVAQTIMDSIGMNVPVSNNCTPNIWVIPPNHEIVLPTTYQKNNQPQRFVDMNYNNDKIQVKNTSMTLSRRFNLIQEAQPNRNEHWSKKRPHFKKPSYNSNDLRQKLSARRKSMNMWNKPTEDIEFQDTSNIDSIDNGRTLPKIQIIKPAFMSTNSDVDDQWLKENAWVQGTQLILNINPLKRLLTGEESCWYVVADTNVLLNNVNLINVIVNSDKACQLMVPDYIMAELQSSSRQYDTNLIGRAHYVLHILSQQFSAGSAVMGKDPVSDSSKLHIFDFCTKLSEQGHNVVLVSNNIQLEKYRNTSNIPLLTVSELKDLLITDRSKLPGRPVSWSDIKICVPNDISISTGEETPRLNYIDELSMESQNDNKISVTNEKRAVCDCSSKSFHENQPEILLRKVDVGVQTDFGSFPVKIDKTTITENNETDFTQTIGNEKRRDIELNCKLSRQPSIEIGKKQFKWRRRKPIDTASNESEKTEASNSMSWEKITINDMTTKCSNDLDIGQYTFNPDGEKSAYDDHNDSSETNSSCIVSKHVPERIIIEETSTSGIISNSASNVDSESIYFVKPNEQIYKQNYNQESDKTNCVMFEVESPAMEDYLKMRCDEWISRFVQIMEEVLTQILQQDPPFFNRKLPPPWTIHEATECIKKKFCSDSDVTDAADKLNGVLFKISDTKGKINVKLKPEEFMEMYSYGVYLIDALQTVLNTSEDLQTAADSLGKLLNDIVNPCQGQYDTFMETSLNFDVNVSRSSEGQVKEDSSGDNVKVSEKRLHSIKSTDSSNNSTSNQRKYNLRSAQRKPSEDNEQKNKPVKFIRNIDINAEAFFSILKLKKINKIENERKLCISNLQEENNTTNTNVKSNEDQNNVQKNEPKIIRNFSKCLEFEEKLKDQQDHLNTVYYPEESEDGELDQYDDDGNEYDDYNYDYENEEYEENDDMETDHNKKDYDVEQNLKDDIGNKIYNQVIGKTVKGIQEAFLAVHCFCEETRNELITVPVMSSSRNLEIREKAVKARSHMDILYKSLNGILSREKGNCDINLQTLKQYRIDRDAAKSDEYRNMISMYCSQANILLDAVNYVIEIVELSDCFTKQK